jgi:hypothetical protein
MRDRRLNGPRPLARTLLLVLLALAASVVAYLTSQHQSRGAVLLGFNESAGLGSYRLQAEVGAPVRRMLVGWNQVEPVRGTWDWSRTDAAYAALRASGLRPLIVALAPPCWTHPSEPCAGTDLGVTPQDPSYDGDWSAFIRVLTKHYPDAVGIEIWNEENLAAGFSPSPNPVRYTQILKEAYQAVKSIDPSMPVISGGLFVSVDSGPGGIGDAHFLHSMYAAGAKGYMDAIGIHIYPTAGSAAGDAGEEEQDLTALRAVRDAAGDGSKPFWITELGESTANVNESQQATDLVAMIKDARADNDVAVVLIDRLIDPSTDGGIDPGYGVFRSDGTPKPAACALSALLDGTLSCAAS